jgi:hypothetical protein
MISCGTYQGHPIRRNISKDRLPAQMGIPMDNLERQMVNNEYLAILRDPQFNSLNVNFMDF